MPSASFTIAPSSATRAIVRRMEVRADGLEPLRRDRGCTECVAQRFHAFGYDAPPDPPAPFLADDQARVGEDLGVVRDGGLCLAEWTDEVTRTDFARLRHQAEQ